MTQHLDLDALQAACKSDLAFEIQFTHEVCEALIDRLRKAESASKWQPIETAPKDSDKEFLGCNGERIEKTWKGWNDGDAPVYVYGDWRSWEPTHWMPLPAAPTSTPTDSADSEEGAKG